MLAGLLPAVPDAHAHARVAVHPEHLRRRYSISDGGAETIIELGHLNAPVRRIAVAFGRSIDFRRVSRSRRQDILGAENPVPRILPERPVAARMTGQRSRIGAIAPCAVLIAIYLDSEGP